MDKCPSCKGTVPCQNCQFCSHCRRFKPKSDFGACRTCENCRWRQSNVKSIDTIVRKYKSNAERRRIGWNLTDDQAKSLLKMPCIYCGYFREGSLNGIDRIENSKGYEDDNCITACTGCNMLKGDLCVFDFIERCKKVAAYAGKYFDGIKKSSPSFTDGNAREGASTGATELG